MAAASRPLAPSLVANAYPLAVASAVFIIAVGLPSTDSDTYWQLATGQWMLGHREFLRQDIFSSTVAGTHFGIGEWLGQVAFAGSFAAPNKFRHEMKGDVMVGSTGEKLFAYQPAKNAYLTLDAPKDRVAVAEVGR